MLNTSEALYQRIGSTWTLDGLYAFLMTPLSLIGMILNLTSIYLLFKINISSTRLYKFDEIYFPFLCISIPLQKQKTFQINFPIYINTH
jgi:hypothetical protein